MVKKIATIHQPNYLPWIGLFSKLAQSDCFIIYDEAQYSKNGFTNRSKIRTPTGFSYLTIPVSKSSSFTRIMDVTLPQDGDWKLRHWKSIYQNYIKTSFFKDHLPFFDDLYQSDFEYLWQINEKILRYLLKCFQIEVEIFKASDLKVSTNLHKTDYLIACLKETGADVYLSGPSGKDYLEYEKFASHDIGLKFSKFQHPIYKQRYPGFEPNLSAIDLLFNTGSQASQIIMESGNMEEAQVRM